MQELDDDENDIEFCVTMDLDLDKVAKTNLQY